MQRRVTITDDTHCTTVEPHMATTGQGPIGLYLYEGFHRHFFLEIVNLNALSHLNTFHRFTEFGDLKNNCFSFLGTFRILM